jgi:mono/diheme cytochrome c family protein
MPRPARSRLLVVPVAVAAVAGLGACGEQGIQLAKSDPDYEGAKIFQQHCSGCHTLAAAGTEGSATNPNGREYVDGPNFNQRKEQVGDVLYAIRNGGFSGAIMPQNIVVGQDAQDVAMFVSRYAGTQAKNPKSPPSAPSSGG